MAIPLTNIFTSRRPLIGMVHLLPLPGAPLWAGSMDAVLDRAMTDAAALEDAGLDGLLVENYNDAPFYPESAPPETVAALAICVREVVRASGLPVRVDLLRSYAAGGPGVA